MTSPVVVMLVQNYILYSIYATKGVLYLCAIVIPTYHAATLYYYATTVD